MPKTMLSSLEMETDEFTKFGDFFW